MYENLQLFYFVIAQKQLAPNSIYVTVVQGCHEYLLNLELSEVLFWPLLWQ